MKNNNRGKGFSLIELMSALAIGSILMAIAIPSYQEHLKNTRIAMAKADLMELAATLERQRTIFSCYDGAACNDNAATMMTAIGGALSDDTLRYYTVTLNVLTSTTFTLRATPNTSTTQQGIGFMEVTHTGAQRWDLNNNGSIGAGEATWKKH
jgi:type IV pilus assembly protein PilE